MQELITLGVSKPSLSPWATNNVFVKKKDEDNRATSDFRRLQELAVTDLYPVKHMRHILDWPGSSRIFSVFDWKNGFCQVELHPASRECTAVRTVPDLLQYTRLPQGLKNYLGTFQRIVSSILGERKGMDVSDFLDDASTGTFTEKEHLASVTTILEISL